MKKLIKKFSILLLMLVFVLTACGNNREEAAPSNAEEREIQRDNIDDNRERNENDRDSDDDRDDDRDDRDDRDDDDRDDD